MLVSRTYFTADRGLAAGALPYEQRVKLVAGLPLPATNLAEHVGSRALWGLDGLDSAQLDREVVDPHAHRVGRVAP